MAQEPPYGGDDDAWTLAQAAALRLRGEQGGRVGIDWKTVAEEIGGWARTRAMRLNLLKLEFAPASEPRAGWQDSVDELRIRVPRILNDSPSLRRRLPELLVDAWTDGRKLAIYGLARDGVDGGRGPTGSPLFLGADP